MKKYIKKHKNGTTWAKGQTESGKMTGFWQWFRQDGSLMRSGYFKNSKQTGKWTTYRKNGSIVKVTDLTK